MRLGSLGIQYVMISQKAHDLIKYVDYEICDSDEYYYKRILRDRKARDDYQKLDDRIDGLFVRDIIIKGLKHGDKII